MEGLVLGLFCAGLLACISLNISVLYALVFGLAVFMLYGRYRGFRLQELLMMAWNGVKTVHNILITFLLIGIMTALWRAAGTIPFIVCHASKLIRPSVFLLMTFFLNSGLSILTGTSFGTAATMGVICSSMGASMNVSPVLTGGAVLSGAFFGDRCSPVSTSALLVSNITDTDIYKNIRRMARYALAPFLISCVIYLILGFAVRHEDTVMDLGTLYSRVFRLNAITIMPAVVILLLSALHVNVRLTMAASILTAMPICLYLQGLPFSELVRSSVSGFYPADAEVAAVVGGGGIVSMVKVACIVCISSAYSDIFNKTGLLNKAKKAVASLSHRTTTFAAVLLSAIVSSMIACNQTLSILLTNQLCRGLYADNSQLAEDLEDSSVVIAPLVPWSIAGAVPLAAANAPASAVLVSFYLILLPLYRLILAALEKGRNRI